MANITLFIPDQLKKRVEREYPEIRWSRVVRNIIEHKLDDLEVANRLALKSRLTLKDVEFLAGKVNEAAGKHAEELLDEARRGS